MDDNKNSIGIVGYWFATNYGGVASYFSLYSTLKKMGYNPFLVENPYLNIDREGVDVFSRNFFKQINAKILECYDNEHLNELNNLADIFLLGSDQVMTTSSIRAFGKLFLMEFLDVSKKKIAMSVSCGGDNLDGAPETVNYAKRMLNDFSAISVREKSAQDIFRSKFGIDAELIIDPIFLSTAQEYKALDTVKIENQSEENVMVSYILDPTADKKQGINNIAEKLGLKKQIILDGRKFTHQKNDENLGMHEFTLPELDFVQWIHYMSKASFIFTDSFHGASMAIIMNKPFIMYANYRRGYPRFLTLADIFNLHERLIQKSSDISDKILMDNIDYNVINVKLEELRHAAVVWLSNALSCNPNTKLNNKVPSYSIDSYEDKKIEKNFVCSKDKCTGCAVCVNVCPKKCINMKPDSEGFSYPQIDLEKCIHCGLCEKKCPVLNRKIDSEKKVLGVYAGYSLDEKVRYMSSSGGAFTEFAKYVLKMSGVCYGVAYDNDNNVVHTRITSEDQLSLFRQSKYVQSDIGTTYANVQNDLKRGLYVLFSGAPCQCAGLKSFLGKEYKKLVVIDFICTAACSPKAYKCYLKDIEEQYNAKVDKVSFRNKETTWGNFSLRIDFKDKKEFYRKTNRQDAYFKAYSARVLFRPSCYECQFRGTDRVSDITIADFWGLKWNNKDYGVEQMKNGVSLFIFNSIKGKNIFDDYTKFHMYSEEHTLEDALKGNGGYYYSQKPGIYREYFFNNLENMPFHSIVDNIVENEERLKREREQK